MACLGGLGGGPPSGDLLCIALPTPSPAAFVHSMSFSVWRWPVGVMVAVVGLRGVAPPEGHSMGLAAGPGA